MISVTLALVLMAGGGLFLAGLMITLLRVSEDPDDAEDARLAERESAPTALVPAALVPEAQLDDTGELRRTLAQAGFAHPAAPAAFGAIKVAVGFAVALLVLALVLWVPALARQLDAGTFSLCVTAFALGYLLPGYVVRRRVRLYHQRIEKAVPDALDLMQICVEAGQSLDLAFRRISRELAGVHPELAAHFAWASQAIAAGLDRDSALLRIAQETGNDDLRLLASTVVQSVRLGTPIVPSLRAFSEDLRDRRVRKIEERVNVLSTKMTLGTMVFTVPPLLLLLLTPALLRIASVL
ncbi:type II secretion system F family protein [Acidimangrovimonas sediminis]|uniref:type II secretion system F family protein n=1 Tax=Acidimangrovimonas sediminis TaxID=2056283 RepID=UPI000C7FB1C4|nr:type II secretion system F family protein [Acidimangrovimonas sediminis]